MAATCTNPDSRPVCLFDFIEVLDPSSGRWVAEWDIPALYTPLFEMTGGNRVLYLAEHSPEGGAKVYGIDAQNGELIWTSPEAVDWR